MNSIGTPLLWSARWSVVVLFLCWGLAAANLSRSTVRRKVYAAGSAVVLLGCAGPSRQRPVRTEPPLGAVLGVSAQPGASLPPLVLRTAKTTGPPSSRLADTWTAPPGMPRQGPSGRWSFRTPSLVSSPDRYS